jgi:hypothetical protein
MHFPISIIILGALSKATVSLSDLGVTICSDINFSGDCTWKFAEPEAFGQNAICWPLPDIVAKSDIISFHPDEGMNCFLLRSEFTQCSMADGFKEVSWLKRDKNGFFLGPAFPNGYNSFACRLNEGLDACATNHTTRTCPVNEARADIQCLLPLQAATLTPKYLGHNDCA